MKMAYILGILVHLTFLSYGQSYSNNVNLNIDDLIASQADSINCFYLNCKISTDQIKGREHGNKIVFHYYYKAAELVNGSDGEYFEEIQFEITPKSGKQKYVTRNLEDFNSIFKWGCFCDYPDSIQNKQNEGEIELIQVSTTIWNVTLRIKSIPFNKTISFNKLFQLYVPSYIPYGRDSLNKFDTFHRKQGHWISEDFWTLTNGVYKDNYFTGSLSQYQYIPYVNIKYISEIWYIEDNQVQYKIKIDESGKPIKE